MIDGIEKPKISIVTPSFNSEKYIEETIKSVVNQGYENYEYIIMDGGSTDGTVEIIRKYDSIINDRQKFRWFSEKDGGQTDAVNKGLRLCTGEWFAFLNSDDYYMPGLFIDITPFLKANSDKGVVYGNQYVIYEGIEQKYNLLKKPSDSFTLNDILYANQVFGPASFYNMKALKAAGEFDTSLYHWMDWDMYIRIMKLMPFKYIDYNMTVFRISTGMKSPSNPDNKARYKKFQKEAHHVSVKNGGHYFSGKWLQKYQLYGKYKYYLRRYEKEPGVMAHDKQDNAKINALFMAAAVSVHYLVFPMMALIKRVRKARIK